MSELQFSRFCQPYFEKLYERINKKLGVCIHGLAKLGHKKFCEDFATYVLMKHSIPIKIEKVNRNEQIFEITPSYYTVYFSNYSIIHTNGTWLLVDFSKILQEFCKKNPDKSLDYRLQSPSLK